MATPTVASKVPFIQLTRLLEKISQRQGTDAKKQLLREFVDEWRAFHLKLHADDPNTTDSFFPAMRLMLPQLEKERQAYGIKEHMLAKNYIEILGLGKDSPSAQKLLNYRAPKSAKADAGDFAAVCYWILKPRCPEKGTMTVEEVNGCLDRISASNAAKEKAGVKKNLEHMLRNMSAQEQKWLIRMLMKEMKMGLSQQSVFSVYHQDAEDLFNVKMSLEKVCTMLRDPSVRLHEVEISVFSPFRPMLGDRGAPSKVEKLMDGKPFLIETKFDGERMQVHKKGDEYKYYSRGGNDYTVTYGADPYSGNLTPFIANCFQEDVTQCILDGEMVGYDPETETVGSKGENFDIKSVEQKKYQPMLCVFDILLYNDEVMSNKPLKLRKEKLKEVLTAVEGRIVFSEYKEGRTKQDCADALNTAIDNREEGIMVKDPESPYKPNTRKGGWYKIKPEYVGGLMDELDLLVVGGYFGGGHRSKMLSHFLCAVAVPQQDGSKPTKFQSFCRVGSGYSKKELYEFNVKLSDHWKPYHKRFSPDWLELASGLKMKPDMWIEPSKSHILQIKAAEIIDSSQFMTGCTLRFPRVEKIRYDKPWYDCMNTADVVEARQQSSGKLTSGHVMVDDENDEPIKKRRKVMSRHVKPTVMAHFRGADISDVKQVSEMLSGKEICILSGSSSHPKSMLEKKVAEFGGTIAQNPGAETHCVVAEKVGLKVRNIISRGLHDVVKVDWLLRCLDARHLLPWVPADIIHASSKTRALLAQDYDRHGDHFYQDTTVDQLRTVFDKVQEKGTALMLDAEDVAHVEMNYFPHSSLHGLFRLCRVYLDQNEVLGRASTAIRNSTLQLVGLQLRMHGATLNADIDARTSHAVVDPDDLSRVRAMRQLNRSRDKKFHVVTPEWVTECVEAEKLLNERHYEPPME